MVGRGSGCLNFCTDDLCSLCCAYYTFRIFYAYLDVAATSGHMPISELMTGQQNVGFDLPSQQHKSNPGVRSGSKST